MTGQKSATQANRKQAIESSLLLGLRQALVQLLGIVNGVVLANILSPSLFGMYAIFTFQFLFHLSIGDLGVGASVIRQEKKPELLDLQVVHLFRQVIDVLQIVLVCLLAPLLVELYGFDREAIGGFRLVALAAFLQSFQVVPGIQMERSLLFGRLTVVEVAQAAVFAVLCISFSYLDYGAVGFGLAWCGYAVTGSLLSLLFCRWRIGWRINISQIRDRLNFGLPFQGAVFVGLLRDSFTPVAIGILLGASSVGYMNWAHMLALSFALGSLAIQRVLLPVYSRAQFDPAELGSMVELGLKAANGIVAPLAVMTLVLAEPITIIVFGSKWLSALPVFYVLWVANLLIPSSAVFSALFNAIGKSKIPFIIVAGMTVATWGVGLPLLSHFGLFGFAVVSVVVHISLIFSVYYAKGKLQFKFFSSVTPAWVAAGCVGLLFIYLRMHFAPTTFQSLIYQCLLFLGVYIGIYLTFYRRDVQRLLQSLRKPIVARSYS